MVLFHESFCGCVVFQFAGRTRGAGAGVWGRICVLFVLLVFGAVCWNLCACAYLCFSMPSCSSARRPIDRLAQDGWYVPGKLAKCEWKFVSDKVVPPWGGRGGGMAIVSGHSWRGAVVVMGYSVRLGTAVHSCILVCMLVV